MFRRKPKEMPTLTDGEIAQAAAEFARADKAINTETRAGERASEQLERAFRERGFQEFAVPVEGGVVVVERNAYGREIAFGHAIARFLPYAGTYVR